MRSNSSIEQQSYSKLEIDITASNLSNVLSNEENIPNNPGLAFIWEDEKKRRRFNQKSSQITPNESQQRPEKAVTRTERYFRDKLVQKLKAIKDNETCMNIDQDETPSLEATYDELNSQSKSLLEILQSLADEQGRNKKATSSNCSSPSLVYSDDENNAAEVSVVSSQPLLQFNAEDDSILGNNFSDDENDIDDHDHRTLSQSITYSKHGQMSSSEDSESEIGEIPQLDGAYDTKRVKKTAPRKVKSSKSIKLSRSNQNQDGLIKKRRYNLRSIDKQAEKSDQNDEFQPRDFKIILKKLDPLEVSPKKIYPRLNIDTQKSPRLNRSKSSQESVKVNCKEPILLLPQITEDSFKSSLHSIPETRNEITEIRHEVKSLPLLPETREETFVTSLPISPSIKAAKPADSSSLLKNDKKVYPQLNISIKKSPKSSQRLLVEEAKPSRVSSNLRGLKKRKINFGDDEKEYDKSKEIIQDADLISSKWKKSLKRKKKDDTSFKIGDSFSLLQFCQSKKDTSLKKICEKSIPLGSSTNTCEMSSQNYSLRIGISESTIINNSTCSTLKEILEENDSAEMETLQILNDEEDTNKDGKGSRTERNNKLTTSQKLVSPSVECDDELTKAAPLNAVQNNEIKLGKNSSTEPSPNLSSFREVVLRIPRIDPEIISNSGSLIIYEDSSIELNISDPNEDCKKSNQGADLPTSKVEEGFASCSRHESIEMESSHLVLDKDQTAATSSKNKLHPTKVSKKKSLGMRIRKNTSEVTLSNSKLSKNTSRALAKNKLDEKSVEKLPKILVDQKDNQKEFNRNLATSLDSFPDSNIVLDITKCSQDELSKSPNHQVQTLSIENLPNSVTLHQNNTSNSANSKDTSCEKNAPKATTNLTSLLTFEDSQIELDIFKFTAVSLEESTKETHHSPKHQETCNLAMPSNNENDKCTDNFDEMDKENGNPASSPSIFTDVIVKKRNIFLSDATIEHKSRASSPEVLFEESSAANEMEASQSILGDCFFDMSTTSLPEQLIDDQNTYFSQGNLANPIENLNENLAKSPTLFSDDFPNEPIFRSLDQSMKTPSLDLFSSRLVKEKLSAATSQNLTTTVEGDDLNTSCSNDSLLNVLESLTPSTKEVLNRKLDSFIREENIVPSQRSNNSLAIPAASVHDFKKPSAEEQFFDDFSDDSVIVVQPTTSGDHNTKYDSVDLCTPDILERNTYSLGDSPNSTSRNQPPAREEVLFEEDSFDLALSDACEDQPVNETPALNKLLLNNSIWDSIDDDEGTQEDNEIQSFYHNQTINPAHVTIIRDITDDDTGDSSPIAKVLTPESQTSNEILSFYGSQSPESMIYSISHDIIEVPEAKSTPSTSKAQRKSLLVAPHSTPTGSSTKKTPSPLYTPVLKKLMMKKVNDKEKRISSQRFHAGPFLSEIREEEEDEKKKKSDRNISFSLPPELECDLSKIDAKSLLNTSKTSTCSGASYQIDGASLENTCGFKMNLENLQDMKVDKQYQFITLISLEVFTQTRGDLKPDPEYDAVTCLFYTIHHDAPDYPNLISGIILVSEDPLSQDLNRFKSEKTVVSSEAELFDRFLALIRKWDPDMFIGYEVEMLSWGFLIQRGYFLGRNLSQELSRIRETKQNEPTERPAYEDDEYTNEIKLPGRIVLNAWRLMRHEVNLQSYTFENILFHVLHQRVPYHSFKFLTECWKDNFKRWIVVDYFLLRTESNITLLEQLDFICRTSELARLFGIQFYEVLSRGSQFRVESMMLRLAKTQNYVAVSPSVKQRAHMRAPESLPLIMEPESKFYTDPIIVLDFQSLYPSIIIAYNYCFSTCLGRIDSLGQNEPFHFGCVEHTIPNNLLVKLENSLNLSPAGVAYVDKTIRKGILPSMLEEILETRLMVKKSMKENKNNSILKRVLHARQLGLKLIANVTYGYTSANFSGRMPCMEIADSVVSKGRETLERAIELVNGTAEWGARVVYGDTDSLFVLVPNRSKEEAFRIGSEIADAVTNQNPKPVKLKLEKVYTASILQTKKRYVGYMYESTDQEKPVYDAKGIETVRRDGCPAVSKILEKSLKLLFETKNVNTVKQYVQRQFTKLISGRISIQELTFAREYRGMNNYKPAACVPALQLAKQALMKDRRAEPRVKERVRYVIVTGAPGVPLIRLVRTPQEFLDTPGSLINTEYYITRAIIPALERCFNLMNVNVQAWYTEVPKKQKLNLPIDYEIRNKTFKKTTISHYFSSSKCISCSKIAGGSVCRQCEHKPQRLALILGNMISQWQRKQNNVAKICRSCCGRTEPIGCSSLDCPVYYLFRQTDQDAEQVRYAEELKREYLYF